MIKEFFDGFIEMKGELKVFWIDGMMYVNDEYEHQIKGIDKK